MYFVYDFIIIIIIIIIIIPDPFENYTLQLVTLILQD